MANGEGMNKTAKIAVGAGLGIPAAALLLIGSYKAKVDNNCDAIEHMRPKVQQNEIGVAELRQTVAGIHQHLGRAEERDRRMEDKIDRMLER